MPLSANLLSIQRGSITAPAGCGKTQLIADALRAHQAGRPILVLTHTNAGVTALRHRLKRANVPSANYRLSTIDGFSMRLIAKFPGRSGHTAQVLELNSPGTDYPAIRHCAAALLAAGHVSEAISATYAQLLVDEYQDCSVAQHAIVAALADIVPTCVLGDPLQAIFGFGNNRLAHWERDVEPIFPSSGSLETPWRWRLAGAETLGHWLMSLRQPLEAGLPVDLRTAPPQVRWVQLTPRHEVQERLVAARSHAAGADGTVLVIGDAMNVRGRHLLASQTPGAMTVETVDLRDLVSFSRTFDPAATNALPQLADFAALTMTGVGATNLVTRVATLRTGRARTPATSIESSALAFESKRSMLSALNLLTSMVEDAGTRVYRPELLYGCLSAMQSVLSGTQDLFTAALQIRERNRHLARPLPRRAVGSTLLLKGLEADIAVVLYPETMTAQHLYVALTRGAKGLVVCSATPVLTPARQ